ncbi:MAG TPA: hypothetical protein VG498_10670 [Terriglobales bacterium]|nr:hypothetical protein [Terriglobales bacterium]
MRDIQNYMTSRDHADDFAEPMSRAAVNDFFKSVSELNETSVDFLKIELDTALTFAGIALQTEDNDTNRARNQHNARRGYDTVVRLMQKVTPSDSDAQLLLAKLEHLKSELVKLGEVI